jgi:hypothetical protein
MKTATILASVLVPVAVLGIGVSIYLMLKSDTEADLKACHFENGTSVKFMNNDSFENKIYHEAKIFFENGKITVKGDLTDLVFTKRVFGRNNIFNAPDGVWYLEKTNDCIVGNYDGKRYYVTPAAAKSSAGGGKNKRRTASQKNE